MQNHYDAQLQMMRKLEQYRALPHDRRFLASLSLEQIFEALPVLTKDSLQIWELCEKVYHRDDFFENVVFKKYARLFDEKSEKRRTN